MNNKDKRVEEIVEEILGRYNAEVLNKYQDKYLMEEGPGCERVLYPVLEEAILDFMNPPNDGMIRKFNLKATLTQLVKEVEAGEMVPKDKIRIEAENATAEMLRSMKKEKLERDEIFEWYGYIRATRDIVYSLNCQQDGESKTHKDLLQALKIINTLTPHTSGVNEK